MGMMNLINQVYFDNFSTVIIMCRAGKPFYTNNYYVTGKGTFPVIGISAGKHN